MEEDMFSETITFFFFAFHTDFKESHEDWLACVNMAYMSEILPLRVLAERSNFSCLFNMRNECGCVLGGYYPKMCRRAKARGWGVI